MPANERFLAGLRQRADDFGILLVVDEIQTGVRPDRKVLGR